MYKNRVREVTGVFRLQSYCTDANIPDPRLLSVAQEDVNFLLATWAVDLLRGNNITGRHLRSATIGGYLQAAAALLKEGGYQFDPLDDQHNTHTKQILSSL
eukprot:CCRYP_006110-RA/>CCRYP_006110-RA protein AED:0.54 eAED:0.45 QI:0/0/0/0.5/0/0/2/0/100